MEDYYFTPKEASRLGVPFISVRAIVDHAADKYVPRPSCASWETVRRQSKWPCQDVSYAVTRPWHAATLMALAKGASRAASSLEEFLKAYLNVAQHPVVVGRAAAPSRR